MSSQPLSFPTDPIEYKSRHEEVLVGIGSEEGPLANGKKLPEPEKLTTDDVVTLIGRAECLKGKGDEFVERLSKHHVHKFNDPTLLAYAIHQQADNPDHVWIYESYKSRYHFQKHLLSHTDEENQSYVELMVNLPPRAPAIDLVMLPAAICKGLDYYNGYKGFEIQTTAKEYLEELEGTDESPDAQAMQTSSLLFGKNINTDALESTTEMVTTFSRSICKPGTGHQMVAMIQDFFNEYIQDADSVLTYVVHQQMDQPDHIWTYATYENGMAVLAMLRGFEECKNLEVKSAMEDILLTTFDQVFSASRLHNDAIKGIMKKAPGAADDHRHH